MLSEVRVWTAFEVQLYFYAPVPLNSEVRLKKLSVIQNVVSGAFVGMDIQLMQKAWDTPTKYSLSGPLHIMIKQYTWLDHTVI